MTIEELFAKAKEKAAAIKTLLEGDEPDLEQVAKIQAEADALVKQAEAMKAAQGIIDLSNQSSLPASLPTGAEPDPEPQDDKDAALKAAVHILRSGDMDDPTSIVMRELYGGDYRQVIWEQDQAFKTFLRTGRADRPLTRQIWGPENVKAMLRDGMSVVEIKATMVEGQNTLGGYAVPPDVAAGILARMKGLTAVRDGGALVVQTASKVIEWLKLTGGGDQYPTAMRGLWGAETESPTGDDFTVGLLQIPVNVYTYKVAMSVSLIEDASNLVQVFTNLVADTLAVDEDTVFLTGDGAGKPYGILPGSANAHSLTEVASLDANVLTIEGLKALKRGVASQYRVSGRASLIGNSDTGGDIETFQDGNGRFYFESLDPGETKVYGATWRESEAMPDVAATAFPLIYGDLSGYAIVERLGLAIQRYNDSNTGINVVEFHIRKRTGGNVVEPWKLCVQDVNAS